MLLVPKFLGLETSEMGNLTPRPTTPLRSMLSVMGRGSHRQTINCILYLVFSPRFSHPSWQVTVFDRKKTTKVLLPDNLDKLKDITTYLSGVLKRPVYADLPDKMFRNWFQKQLVEHINSRDINKVIVSYTG